MNSKGIVFSFVSSIALLSFSADSYKLKTSVTANLLGADGSVIEQKVLKAGTVVVVMEADNENKNEGAKKATRLTVSKMSVNEFRQTKPSAGAVFRVEIKPCAHAAYYGIFEGKEKSIIQYELRVLNDQNDGVSYFTAYVQKTGKIGKILRTKLSDGVSKLAYAKIRIIKQMDDNDVYLDDVEFL